MKGRMPAIQVWGLFLLLLLLVSPVLGAGKNHTVKIATLAPEGSSWMKIFKKLDAEIREKTQGAVRFRIYPGGVLGDESDMVRKLRISQVHGAALTAAGLAKLFPEVQSLQVPFLFRSYDEVDYVLDKMDHFFKKGFEDNGYTLLGWSEAGFVYLMSTYPVQSVSDLQKVKVWIWQDSAMSNAIFHEADISAIPLSVPDVLVGLQTGMVDVVYAPPTAAISMQWFTRVKYLTDVPLLYLVGGVVVRNNVLRKMPQEYRNTVLQTSSVYMSRLRKTIRDENNRAIKVMQKHGVKVIQPSGEQIAEFKALSQRAMQKLRRKAFSDKIFQEISSHLERYRGEKR